MEKFKVIALAILNINVEEQYIGHWKNEKEWSYDFSHYYKGDDESRVYIEIKHDGVVIDGSKDDSFTKTELNELKGLIEDKYAEKCKYELQRAWIKLGVISL